MDRASSLIFPGSRTLAGWWRQLAPRQPLALGIGYAFLHRIEAPVNVRLEQPIEPLVSLVLQAITLEETDGASLSDLQERLRLPAPVVQRVLADMRESGLLTVSAPDRWRPTDRGNHAPRHGAVPVCVPQRRSFPFVERMDATGLRIGPPHFLPIAECVGAPWPVDERTASISAACEKTWSKPPPGRRRAGFRSTSKRRRPTRHSSPGSASSLIDPNALCWY